MQVKGAEGGVQLLLSNFYFHARLGVNYIFYWFRDQSLRLTGLQSPVLLSVGVNVVEKH